MKSHCSAARYRVSGQSACYTALQDHLTEPSLLTGTRLDAWEPLIIGAESFILNSSEWTPMAMRLRFCINMRRDAEECISDGDEDN